jgi:hypothetical protein
MDVRCLADLWCALRRDPAFGGDAHAAHPSHREDQVAVDVEKQCEGLVGQGGEIPLKRPATSRFEVEQQ